MHPILSRIDALLRRYDFNSEANLSKWLHEKSVENAAERCKLLNNKNLWDEKDSIAAIDPALECGFTRQARTNGQA